jgi:hypothetical protein
MELPNQWEKLDLAVYPVAWSNRMLLALFFGKNILPG